MATFVCVHGAFQGGWVWGKVADLLRTRGHDVHTPTLSGCGYLAKEIHQELNPNAYIADLRNYIEFENLGEIILLAHSFSGMVCGALMMKIPERIRHAVFIDAVIPESQRSFVDMAGEPFRLLLEKHRREDGSARPWPLQVFGVTGPEATWFETRLRPFSYKDFHTPFPVSFDPRFVSTSYISHKRYQPVHQRTNQIQKSDQKVLSFPNQLSKQSILILTVVFASLEKSFRSCFGIRVT